MEQGENLFRGYNPIIKSIGCDVDGEGGRIPRSWIRRGDGTGDAN